MESAVIQTNTPGPFQEPLEGKETQAKPSSIQHLQHLQHLQQHYDVALHLTIASVLRAREPTIIPVHSTLPFSVQAPWSPLHPRSPRSLAPVCTVSALPMYLGRADRAQSRSKHRSGPVAQGHPGRRYPINHEVDPAIQDLAEAQDTKSIRDGPQARPRPGGAHFISSLTEYLIISIHAAARTCTGDCRGRCPPLSPSLTQ